MVQHYPLFGAHMSVAGGLHKAIDASVALGMETVQIFTKNNNQWNCKPLEESQIEAWKTGIAKSQLSYPIAHTSYLINVASPDETLWQKSIDALVIEWQRADALELDGLVLHPGAFTTSSIEAGVRRVVDAVRKALDLAQPRRTRLLLENTAGQGTCLGSSFQQLGEMLTGIAAEDWLGVCMDTCHAFAAGYDLSTDEGFKQLKREIKNELPKKAIKALHLNDSKKECGSRVDRHEHIGLGMIGDVGFVNVFADSLFRKLPGYLETEKGVANEAGDDWDAVNLQRLRTLWEQAH